MSALRSEIAVQAVAQLRAIWRRRWFVLGVAWVLSLAGWAMVAMLPDRYQSMTRIYVETENLLTPLLRNLAVQSDMQNQVQMMQRTLLNRENMAEVVRATDMDIEVHSDIEKEALYARLQKEIHVTAEGRNLFTVTYSDGDPQRAKKVVGVLLNLFMETNVGQTRASMENARSFIEKQLAEYESTLKVAERKVAEYRAKNHDLLAATGANFAARIDQARQDVSVAKLRLEEATVARNQVRAHLGSVPQYIDLGVVAAPNGSPVATGQARVGQLENELALLKMRYTERHPDVIATARMLEQTRAELGSSGGGGADPGRNRISNPLYEQIKLRQVQADADVAMAQGNLRLSEENFIRLNALNGTAPKVETELADLNREYGVLRARYEELLSRRESARISEAVESHGDKVQFRIIEPPSLPLVPIFPNRKLFMTGVLVLAIAVGVGLAVLMHQLDDTIKSVQQMTSQLHLRVIGTVPKVDNLSRSVERRRSLVRFSLAAAGLGCAFVLAVATTSNWMSMVTGHFGSEVAKTDGGAANGQ